MHLEFQNITSMLAQNGFSPHIIQNQIRKFLDKKHQIVQNKGKQEKSQFVFIRLPFIGDISYHIQNELNDYFRRKLSTKLKIRIIHLPCTIGNLFKYKDKQELLHSTGVVYQLTYSCKRKYVYVNLRETWYSESMNTSHPLHIKQIAKFQSTSWKIHNISFILMNLNY